VATSNKFSCFIIGEGILPIRCAEILLDRQHMIYGIISSDVAVHDWAREREIAHIDPDNEDIVTFLSRHPFNYLFSIVNSYILPKQVLEFPRRCAINYHDAPLPRYAGSHATSWAIMQGERVHGVTWHAMTERVDGGDIFKQYLFEIDEDETAFTLNAKCYDAAISSFAELIDDLSCDRLSARKQNLNERTFFSLYKRPSSGCLLSWHRSAHDISAFVRALDFGPNPNPMGLPKIAIGMDFIIVSEIEVLNSISAVPPGRITHIDPGFVRVSTIDSEIALHKLKTIDGQPFPISDFIAKFGLYVGYQFKELDQEAAIRITAYHASICQYEAFWTKQLETLENITLPYMHGKTSHLQTARCSYVPMPVPREITNLLENRYATWHRGDVLLAAFVAYLARIGGTWSFAIGYRDIELKSDVADLEGIFAAYVPVMMEYRQGFEEVLHAVLEQVQLAKQRKTYARDIMARYPVLRSKANLQGAHLPSIFVERVEALHDCKAPYGSELTLAIREDGVECLWVYNAEVLDEESVVEMQQGFTTFLQGIVSDPQQRISDLPLLTKAEQYRLLVEWNATQADYPTDQCIHQLFEAQVQRTPEVVAAVFEHEQLTYYELNRRANQLAHHLQQLGVGSDVLVGICVERSLDMLVGVLGILKAGGAYVPLDPAFPSERIAFMLEDAQAPVLVTQQHLTPQLPRHKAKVICLDADAAVLAQQSESNLLPGATFDQLAYVIYTSGSTGRPKGVQILHRAVVNFLLSMRQQPGLTAQDCLLAITTLSFDIAALELFLPLIVGARVVVASRETAANGAVLAEILTQAGVTVMQATPSSWRLLLAAGWQGKPDLKILCGGEALPLDLAQQLLPRAASLWNLYGPTETTIWSSICKIEPSQEVITIGRPIANTQIYLLDPQLQPVPVGVAGELCIGGDGLARGYLNRPKLTAEHFILHPFSNEPGARLYKTGDLARYRSDGGIEHLGRLDFQVKLRGYRIELGEIETMLSQHPAVHQAVVVAREDVPGDKRLVAYVVLRENQTAMANELKSHVMKEVPDYMVPSTFVLLETLPLTPNGKIDRRALPPPEPSRSTAEEPYVAPRLPLHHQLVQIWEDLLGVHPIGINDDFFDLGGHSLLATRMIDRIAQVYGKKLPLSTLFAGATIEHLATALMGETKTDSRAPLAAVQTSGSRKPFFFLHGQWKGDALYNRELARYLGPDQPFYVLEPYRFDGLVIPPTYEAVAAAHIEVLRSVQPEGPYLLGGWCNGGLMAYEMARQLHTQGQTVDLLVLMDPDPPAKSWKWERRIIIRLANLLRLRQEKQVDWFLSYRYSRLSFWYWRSNKIKQMRRTTKQGEPGSEQSSVDAIPTQLDAVIARNEVLRHDWVSIYDWMVADYMPQSYPGKITIFWTDEELFRRERWSKSMESKIEANNVEDHIIPGNHITSRTQYLPVLAEHLRICLSKVQSPLLS